MRARAHTVAAGAFGLSVAVSLGEPGVGPAGAASCTPAPQTIPVTSRLVSGGTPRLRVGGVVYVILIEPEKYSARGYPAGFPWLRATSTDRGVLAPIRLCPPAAATLPVTVAAFRAVRAGHATVSAPLAPKWRTRQAGLHRFRAVVTVVG